MTPSACTPAAALTAQTLITHEHLEGTGDGLRTVHVHGLQDVDTGDHPLFSARLSQYLKYLERAT